MTDQVLLGTILGGSSLVKPPKGLNCYLSMRGQNERWLMHKARLLPKLFPKPKPRCYGGTYRLASGCLEELTNLKSQLFVGSHRHVTMDILDSFHAIGLAVWYLDGGGTAGRLRKNAYLITTKLGEDGSQVVRRYFNEIGMPCNINREGKRRKVLFTVAGTRALFDTIRPHVPKFMAHRIRLPRH